MGESRPDFYDIASFDEFSLYYWYREELSQICKTLGLEYRGTKQELNRTIEEYFKGNRVEKSPKTSRKKTYDTVALYTPLLECGFSFNQDFRDYFSTLTGIESFKFNADMATAWRKVKREKDVTFTIQDMIDVYYGKLDYAQYDHSVCQWNQFYKDFCSDKLSHHYSYKLKVASILWKEVRDSGRVKIYSKEILSQYSNKVEKYLI